MVFNCKNISQILISEHLNFLSETLLVLLKTKLFALFCVVLHPNYMFILKVKFIIID